MTRTKPLIGFVSNLLGLIHKQNIHKYTNLGPAPEHHEAQAKGGRQGVTLPVWKHNILFYQTKLHSNLKNYKQKNLNSSSKKAMKSNTKKCKLRKIKIIYFEN